MADYLPHTDDDVDSMLAFLGMDSLDDLFAHIPRGRATRGRPGPRPGHERARRRGDLRRATREPTRPRRRR